MLALTHQLLGHAFSHGVAHVRRRDLDATADPEPIDSLMLCGIVLTAISALMIFASIKYTVENVIATIAMVEDSPPPPAGSYKDEKDEKDEETDALIEDNLDLEPVAKPLTCSIAATAKHLRSIGGLWADWRGISAFIGTSVFHAILTFQYRILFTFLPIPPTWCPTLSATAAAMCIPTIHGAWTHIVISMPSTQPWYRRGPTGWSSVKRLALPAGAVVLAEHATAGIPMHVHAWFGPLPQAQGYVLSEREMTNELLRFLATAAVGIVMFAAVYLPALVTLIRMEASLLPKNVETVVPFDRTLGGAAPNEDGEVDYLRWVYAATATYGREGRRRLVKFYVKLAGMTMFLYTMFGLIIGLQAMAIGPDKLAQFSHDALHAIDEVSWRSVAGIRNWFN